MELVIGYIRHRKIFVVSNRAPEYSEEEIIDRQLKAKMSKTL